MGTGRTDEFRKDAVRIALTSGLTRGGFNRSSQQPLTGVVDAHRKTQIGELDAP